MAPFALIPLCLLVLQFDGSFRKPRDRGFPTSSLGQLATCSAAVWNDNRVVSLGGMRAAVVPDMTSTDTEFEGLLLGLRWLTSRTPEWWEDQGAPRSSTDLLIRGDCKTIVDQFNGKSLPRRLQPKHKLAEKLLSQLVGIKSIRFEHVRREENALCDSVCTYLMGAAAERATTNLRNEVERIGTMPLPDSAKGRKAKESPMKTCLEKHLSEGTLIPISWRPSLYGEILEVCKRTGDGLGLCQAGTLMGSDAKEFPSCPEPPAFHNPDYFMMYEELLSAISIECRVEGLGMLGKQKEGDKLQRRHRYILSKFGSSTGYNAVELLSSLEIPDAHESLLDNEAMLQRTMYNAFMSWQQRATTDRKDQKDESIWISINGR